MFSFAFQIHTVWFYKMIEFHEKYWMPGWKCWELADISVEKKKVKLFKILNIKSWWKRWKDVCNPFITDFLKITWIQAWFDSSLGSMQKDRTACFMTLPGYVLLYSFFIWHFKLESPRGTTFCALEGSALPGVLVYNWHLLRQPGFSFSIYPAFPLYCLACSSRTGHLH